MNASAAARNLTDSDPHPYAPALLTREEVRSMHVRESWRHGVRLGIFMLLYAAGAGAAVMASSLLPGGWRWLAAAPAWLLAAASLHGISLLTHEAVHGTLCRSPWLNNPAGALCALPVLQNFSAYRVLHLRHHRHLGEEGDPDHYTNYTRWSWLVFSMHWLRLVIGYPVYLAAIPLLGFRHGRGRDRAGILAEVLAAAAVITLVWHSSLPGAWIWQGWGIPMLVINLMVNIRGMSQHTLLEAATDEIRGTRSILTSPVVRFFMCNENYHLEHHLYPGVPWHHLPQVHRLLRDRLTDRGAPYIPSYTAFVGEFLCHSLRRSPLGWRHGRRKP